MSETFERITPDQVDAQAGHVYRYELARDWVAEAESVLDIACGIGYGAKILAQPVLLMLVLTRLNRTPSIRSTVAGFPVLT